MKTNSLLISSFWSLFSALPKDEAAEFVDFTESAYFNGRKALCLLAKEFNSLSAQNISFTREEVYALAFKGKEYNAQVMNNYLSELKSLLHEYLQIKWLSQHSHIKEYALAETLLQANNFDAFEKQRREYSNENNFHTGDEQFYRIKFHLLEDEYLSSTAKKKKFNLLENCVSDFRTYYLTETMRMYCELVNRKNLKGVEFNTEEMDEFIAFYKLYSARQQNNPLPGIYYRIFHFLQHIDDGKSFEEYKNLLIEHISAFTRKTARDLCLYGQNHCVKHINLNHHQYLTELFDIYNIMIRENILYEGQYMTQWTFKNYTTVALRIKEYDKAENFIEQYHNKLMPAVRHDAYHYNLASIYFEKKDYDRAMLELHKIHFSDPVYYLDGRSMLLKIYFDNTDFEALQSLYHSVRTYLLRNKVISKKQADLYKNLFLYTYKLARMTNGKSYFSDTVYTSGLKKLEQKISSADIANKPWLLEKIAAA